MSTAQALKEVLEGLEADEAAQRTGAITEGLEIPVKSGRSENLLVRMYPQEKALLEEIVRRRKARGLPQRCSISGLIREAIAQLALKELGGSLSNGRGK